MLIVEPQNNANCPYDPSHSHYWIRDENYVGFHLYERFETEDDCLIGFPNQHLTENRTRLPNHTQQQQITHARTHARTNGRTVSALEALLLAQNKG